LAATGPGGPSGRMTTTDEYPSQDARVTPRGRVYRGLSRIFTRSSNLRPVTLDTPGVAAQGGGRLTGQVTRSMAFVMGVVRGDEGMCAW
jgi:hypothetical protein